MRNDQTTYNALTHPLVIQILERFIQERLTLRFQSKRLKIHYGDTMTGRAWGDVETGYVGRSTGTQKVPLLLPNARSLGGAAILDHCIVKLEHANQKDGGILYQHPTFQAYEEDR
jgi:hypothetical protein